MPQRNAYMQKRMNIYTIRNMYMRFFAFQVGYKSKILLSSHKNYNRNKIIKHKLINKEKNVKKFAVFKKIANPQKLNL